MSQILERSYVDTDGSVVVVIRSGGRGGNNLWMLMNCEYCGGRHAESRCPSCGAPNTIPEQAQMYPKFPLSGYYA